MLGIRATEATPPPPPRLRLHPVLFALLPVLLLYTGNLNDVWWPDLLAPGLIVLGASLPVWWLAGRVTRHRDRGAVLASLFWVWFFAYGHLQRWLEPSDDALAWVSVALYWGTLAIPFLLVSFRRDYHHVSRALEVVALGLVVVQVATIGHYEFRRLRRPPASADATIPLVSHPPTDRPSIFFIVLDGYARSDVMQEVYGYDNRPFLGFLRRHGFQVATRSRANYAHTLLSLSSCLDLDYLDTLAASAGRKASDRRPLIEKLRTNRTRRFLQTQGYQLLSFASGFPDTNLPEAPRRLAHRGAELNDFESALLQNTPLWPLLRARLQLVLDGDHVRARAALWAFDHLPAAARSPRPVFVFAHIVSPHQPFIFRRDGTIRAQPRVIGLGDWDRVPGKREEYLAEYREQAEFITHRTQTMVEELLHNAARPTAIVLLSDHGPSSGLDWYHPETTDMQERFGNLVAVRLPEGHQAPLADDISLVNVMRFVLRQCLGADLPPRPSRSYFSTYGTPYNFLLVAGEDGRLPRGSWEKGKGPQPAKPQPSAP